MRIEGKEYRTIWFENNIVNIIDQTKLPHKFIIKNLKTVKDSINAIKNMEVRGIGLHSGTYVTSVDGDFITLSSPPSSTGIPKGTTLTFYSPTTLINASDLRFKMTQATDDGSTAPSEVIVEGDLIIKSVGTYDVDVDLDLGAFIEADNTAPPAA